MDKPGPITVINKKPSSSKYYIYTRSEERRVGKEC